MDRGWNGNGGTGGELPTAPVGEGLQGRFVTLIRLLMNWKVPGDLSTEALEVVHDRGDDDRPLEWSPHFSFIPCSNDTASSPALA